MTNEITTPSLEQLKTAIKEINSYYDPREASYEHVKFVINAFPALVAKVESLSADAKRPKMLDLESLTDKIRSFGYTTYGQSRELAVAIIVTAKEKA